MGQAGLVGFVSGFMFAGGQVIPAITNPQRAANVKYEQEIIKKGLIEQRNCIIRLSIILLTPTIPMKQDPELEKLVTEYASLVDEMMGVTVYPTCPKTRCAHCH